MLARALRVLLVASVSLGEVTIPVADAVRSVLGSGDPADDFFVNELRLPRALAALLVGVALGLSGAIFQTIARNPLASPDIIGVTAGASAAAVGGHRLDRDRRRGDLARARSAARS